MEGKPFEDLQAIIAQIVSPQPITFSGYYMPIPRGLRLFLT